jgi:hypothetical protein
MRAIRGGHETGPDLAFQCGFRPFHNVASE